MVRKEAIIKLVIKGRESHIRQTALKNQAQHGQRLIKMGIIIIYYPNLEEQEFFLNLNFVLEILD